MSIIEVSRRGDLHDGFVVVASCFFFFLTAWFWFLFFRYSIFRRIAVRVDDFPTLVLSSLKGTVSRFKLLAL